MFINLRVYSEYSLGSSTIRIKELVKHCVKYKLPAVAITDKNNLCGSLEFAMEASKSGVQPIMGLDLTIKYQENCVGQVILLATNEAGFTNLLKLSSDAYLESKSHEKFIPYDSLVTHSSGLIALIGGDESYEKSLYLNNKIQDAQEQISKLASLFVDRCYIEISRNKHSDDDSKYEDFLLALAVEKNIPIVATNPTYFMDAEYSEAQDAFLCIANSRYLLEEDRPKSNPENYFKLTENIIELFADLPEAISNTVSIAKKCCVYAESRNPLLPNFSVGSVTEEDELAKEAKTGLEKRFIESGITDTKQYFDRLDFELSVISRMKYAGYFLIVSDFIRWSKEQNIPVGPGRGSGAGSVVAWSLDITDLDPLRYGLLFERFLNPDRVSMPDFDIDFCQDRRQEVIEYVRSKYGNDKVAQIITFGKLQARAVLRDVGRVLQMPYMAVDKICKMVPNNPANPVTLKEAIELDKELKQSAETNPEIAKLLNISLKLEGLNRHASTHAAGIVIADRPIVEIVPLYIDENADMPAVQYNMKYAEAAGLVKFDFLGLKTLTVISWACNLIKVHTPNFDIRKIDFEDEKTYALLSRAETTGVFQFESAGMREAIKKLKPDAIEDLIALGSLYRPGPMDNIPSYINRKHGFEKPDYLHPLMESILKETYGIIVYQEQVMEIAKVMAGYSLGEADLLRRAMGKKIKAEMEAQRAGFIRGCDANKIERQLAEEIFALIEKFASYGFNKSHAAAYAIISYQTAFLKANYPVEFLVASMNLEIGDTDKISMFIQEAKRMGIKVLNPNINHSEAKFIAKDGGIIYALGALKNAGLKAVETIAAERKANGEFKDVFDVLSRCIDGSLNKRLLESMIKSGALDDLYSNRHELLENTELLLRFCSKFASEKDIPQIGLFDDASAAPLPKTALKQFEEWSMREMLDAEFEAVGFYLSKHPLESLALALKKLCTTESIHVEGMASFKGVKLTVAGVITSRKIRSSPRGKYAFVQLSDRSGILEISIFNEKLLYENDKNLEVGKVVIFGIEARKDDKGLRAIVESIRSMDEAVGNIQINVDITINDMAVVGQLVSKLSNDNNGKPVHLAYQTAAGDLVQFKTQMPYFVDDENYNSLLQLKGISINER